MFTKTYKKILFFSFFLIFLTSCGKDFFKYSSAKDNPVRGLERAKKNVDEGRGVSLGDLGKGRGTTYEFSTSNPLWRASLDILDFMPLTSANYSGGIIITDWYSEEGNSNDSVKITIRFLSNEIRSDAVDIDVFYKNCISVSNCSISKKDGPLKKELTKKILSKAAVYQKQNKKKNSKPYNNQSTPGD